MSDTLENNEPQQGRAVMDANDSVLETFADAPAHYHQAAMADNTRKAYCADLQYFIKKGGMLPAEPATVVRYMEQCAAHINPRSLRRHLVSIGQWHKLNQVRNPLDDPIIAKTLKGIERIHGKPKAKARALSLKDLDRILKYFDGLNGLTALRNRAMLLVGYCGAFRRSELVSLTWEQVHFEAEGLRITLSGTKNDPGHQGQTILLPIGDDTHCPVRHLLAWKQGSQQDSGIVFRRLFKSSRVSDKGMAGVSFNTLFKEWVASAGIVQPEEYSSHSLRRGFATEAYCRGQDALAIQVGGRWKSIKMVYEYIDATPNYKAAAVNALYDFENLLFE